MCCRGPICGTIVGPRRPIKEIFKLSADYESVMVINSYIIGYNFHYHNTVIISGGRTEKKVMFVFAHIELVSWLLLRFQRSSFISRLLDPKSSSTLPSLLVYYYYYYCYFFIWLQNE